MAQPCSSSSLIKQIGSLSLTLRKESLAETHPPCAERCIDVLTRLEEVTTTVVIGDEKTEDKKTTTIMNVSILEKTQAGKYLTKAIKSFNRHKRTATTTDMREKWDDATQMSTRMLTCWKAAAETETTKKVKVTEKKKIIDPSHGLPKSAALYRNRLVSQKKELYKDPPALPPAHITILDDESCSPPKRNDKTKVLTFASTSSCTNLIKDFHPNVTPEEVLRVGSFGGTYFRNISSAVTGISYKSSQVLQDTVDPEWIAGLNKATMLTSSTYRANINKHKVKCGGSLGMWESSGWISDVDPYGWFQWYCRFYRGRRCSDDERQISRWMKSAGAKGRFRSQLCNKIIAANDGKNVADVKVSPVIRQTLTHWGLEITDNILELHRKRTGK
uniref:Uncharacterized protein n=1 Tax=Eucampia antarctica TaxID=49252 RepID=A0A7S2W068_9STRA|mmetsp:Transcript_14274/g.13782  ORF Transcript_14274/g.13782 Transcript_14274/m.13782 type:complete len:388 (+) Transcript_14274:2-1165(+)